MFCNKAVCILGPTCIGKTDLSIKLLKYFPFDIISVDSCMVYKGLSVGTGKPDKLTLLKFKHNLVDLYDPEYNYTVFNFIKDVFFFNE